MTHNLKVGDRGMIPVEVTRIDKEWVTFTIAGYTVSGYAHPITVYEPAITVSEPMASTWSKKGAQFPGPPE